jgi:hypothetical protein
VLQADALDAARQVVAQLTASTVLPPMRVMMASSSAVRSLSQPSFLKHAQRELGIAVREVGSERVGVLGQQRLAVALDAEARPERAAAVLHVKVVL